MNRRDWATKDFYGVLGVNRKATPRELKLAYRAMAFKHHPDANNGDARSEERFKGIIEAYSTLEDPVQRSLYDRARAIEASNEVRQAAGFGKFRVDVSAMWPGMGPPVRGNDLTAEVVLTHKEARQGVLVRLDCPDYRRPTRTAIVYLHPGVLDGEQVFVKGKGGFGRNGGGFGDLRINVKVTPMIVRGWEVAYEPGPRTWEDAMASINNSAQTVRAVLKEVFGNGRGHPPSGTG